MKPHVRLYDSEGHRLLSRWLARTSRADTARAIMKRSSENFRDRNKLLLRQVKVTPEYVSRLAAGRHEEPSASLAALLRDVCGVPIEAWNRKPCAIQPTGWANADINTDEGSDDAGNGPRAA